MSNPVSPAIAALVGLFVASAHAQTAPPAQPTTEPQTEPVTVLETVVVSGDRVESFAADLVQAGTFRNARLLDTPLTVNVIPREVLDAQAATGLYDALRNTAGVTRSQLNGTTYDNVAIRGITVENRGNYRLNGSLPIINLIDLPLENKQRVEVLKGASALYYGFTSPAGIVNMTTKRAEREPLAVVQLSAGSHGALSGHVDAATRFGHEDKFGVRFNGVLGHLDPGIDQVDGDRSLAAVAFDWDATASTTVQLDVEHIRKDIAEPAAIAALPAVDGVITLPPVPDATTNLAGEWQHYDAQATNVLARVQTDWTDRLSSVIELGQAETQRDRVFSQFLGYDLATGAGTLRASLSRGQYFRNRNGRAEVAAALATGPVGHELVLGLTRNERFQNGRGSQMVDFPQNLYEPLPVPETAVPAILPDNPSIIRDDGLYLFDRMQLGEQWLVLAGVRYSDYESESRTALYQETQLSPSLGLVYKPRDHWSVYATYLEGLEEGGTAPSTAVNAFEVLPPATSEQFEVGTKYEAAAGLVLSLAGFQIERPSAFTNENNRYVLDGLVQYRGLEFALAGELSPDLSVIASGIWLDAEQQDAADPRLIGKRPENTPRHTASLFAEYRVPMLQGLAVNAGAFYIGDRAVNMLNQAYIGGVTTFSAGARYRFDWTDHTVSVQFNIENLTDKDYWSAAGNGLLSVGAPRTAKLSVSVAL